MSSRPDDPQHSKQSTHDGVAADLLGSSANAAPRCIVDHVMPAALQRRHVLLGAAAGGYTGLDATLMIRGDVFRIGRRGEARRKSQVTRTLVGDVAAVG